MPELWQSLFISPSIRPPSDKSTSEGNPSTALAGEHSDVVCKHYISLVKGWFDRAKEQPLLSLHFWLDMEENPGYLETTTSASLISEVLVANAQRFRYLDVGADHAVYLQKLLTDNHSVKLDNLESLVLRLHDLSELSAGTVTTFRSTPKLRRVALQSLMVDWPSLLRWSKLTHLRTTDPISPHTWIALLRECADLQSGVFYIRTEDVPAPAILNEEYTCLHLSDLRIVFLSNPDGKLFRNLRLPAIKTLQLRSFLGVLQFVNPLDLRQLMSSLTTFTLINFAIHVHDLLDLLRVSPNLLSFEFAGSSDIDHELLCERLRYVESTDSGIEVLLPRLERLSLHVPAHDGQEVVAFPTTTFVDMIKSRRNVELWTSASTMITGTLSSLSHLTFSARDKHAVHEVEHALAHCCSNGLIGQFTVITNKRWGFKIRHNDLEHWY